VGAFGYCSRSVSTVKLTFGASPWPLKYTVGRASAINRRFPVVKPLLHASPYVYVCVVRKAITRACVRACDRVCERRTWGSFRNATRSEAKCPFIRNARLNTISHFYSAALYLRAISLFMSRSHVSLLLTFHPRFTPIKGTRFFFQKLRINFLTFMRHWPHTVNPYRKPIP
jgi:hypothetical protein